MKSSTILQGDSNLSVHGAFSPIAGMHGSINEEMEVGLRPLRIGPVDSSKVFLLPLLVTLPLVSLEVLVPEEVMFLPGNTSLVPFKQILRQFFRHLGLFMPLNL